MPRSETRRATEMVGPERSQQRRPRASVDHSPWLHPFLSTAHIAAFRTFSDQVHEVALSAWRRNPRTLDVAFAVNMAQNMYKWSRLARQYGATGTLYLHPQDATAISRPEWEEFDGEHHDLLDGAGFLTAHPEIEVDVPTIEPPNDGVELWEAYADNARRPRATAALRETVSRRYPAFAARLWNDANIARLRLRSPSVDHDVLLNYSGIYPNFRWAEMLARHEVVYVASAPIAALASGKPYCICPVGGDVQIDAGRTDDYGRATLAAFRAAHFVLISNPHILGHCRRLGLMNAVYLPYPMDTERYCEGDGLARAEWKERYGGEVFVLTTARLDSAVKGHTDAMFDALSRLAHERPGVRFVFLGWGAQAKHFQARIDAASLGAQFIILPPVGKRRLIDYYRSSDIVLDQFVYGYYGATALEAAAIGKPVVMNVRTEHYAPLYRGDVAPVAHAATPVAVCEQLLSLIDSADRRRTTGKQLRQWIVRTHGEKTMVPLMLALLQMAADRVPVPADFDNPLREPLTADEREYHRACLQ